MTGTMFFLLVLMGATAKFEPAPLMSHFAAEHQLVLAPHHADLVLEVNLTAVSDTLDTSCDMMILLFNRTSYFMKGNTDVPSPLMAQFTQMCQHSSTLWDSYLDIATGNSEIQPRFLTAILSCLAVGVGSYIFGSTHAISQTDKQLLANDKHFVQVLRAFDHRGRVQHEEIRELARIVHGAMAKTEKKLDSIDAAVMVLSAFQAQTIQLIPFTRALESVMIHRKLSPGLLAPHALIDKLDHLRIQTEKKDLRLVSMNEIDLFQFPLSFASFASGIMKIVVHVPVTSRHLTFDVFRVLTAPVEIEKQFYEVLVGETHLAVSADRQSYFPISTADFYDCLALADKKVCTRQRTIRRRAYPSCGWGVFISDPDMVLQTCRVAKAGAGEQAFYLGNSKFLLFHPVKGEAKLMCNNEVRDTVFFAGFFTVTVPAFCKVISNCYTLFGSGRVARVHAHVKVAPLSFSTSNFSHFHLNEKEVNDFMKNSRQIVHIPAIPDPVVPLDSWWTWSCVGGVGLALFLISVLCLCLFVRFRRNLRTIQKLSLGSQSGSPNSHCPPPQYPSYQGGPPPSASAPT